MRTKHYVIRGTAELDLLSPVGQQTQGLEVLTRVKLDTGEWATPWLGLDGKDTLGYMGRLVGNDEGIVSLANQ